MTTSPVGGALVTAVLFVSGHADAQGLPTRPAQGTKPLTAQDQANLDAVGIVEHVGKAFPKDLSLKDENGRRISSGELFDGKRPVVLTFAYYTCPMLCGMLLRAVTTGLKDVGWGLGDEYRAVTISIDPEDLAKDARKKREEMLNLYSRRVPKGAWHFTTADPETIARATKAAGFGYRFDPSQGQYAHTAVAVILTPDGTISRYLYGLRFESANLKLALLEASEGKYLSSVEQLILYCYRYNTKSGQYVVLATRVMQIGGAITAMVLGLGLLALWRRDRKRRKRAASPGADGLSLPQADGSVS